MRPPERPPRPGALRILSEGQITVRGRLPWSSNGTFLVELSLGEENDHGVQATQADHGVQATQADHGVQATQALQAVYKPLRGERPLWDYPRGLYRREVATYVLSELLGWGLVPETVERDGPLGPGSLQRFVEADFNEHYFTLLERPEHHDALQAICALDLLVNNGDRKSGHCLVERSAEPDRVDRIWAIDHGLCLHTDPKLRTVIWDFGGQPIRPSRVEDIARLALSPGPPPGLDGLLAPPEVEALLARATALVKRPVFPAARSARAFPWPLV